MSDSEEKYALEYHTAEDPDPQGPPFIYRSHYLDDVVAEAWRLRDSGGRPIGVVRSGETIFDRDGLDGVLERVTEARDSDPDRDLREVAAAAIDGKTDAPSALEA